MVETYRLNEQQLPTIPVPHDCVIETITLENQWLVFSFEQDIGDRDSVKEIMPGAKSLAIKFHLVDEEFCLYQWHKPIKFLAGKGFYKQVDSSLLYQLASSKFNLEYLNHYVAYQSLMIEMCASTEIRVELSVDSVEFHWN